MKNKNARPKMFALISAIALIFLLHAIAGCDVDSVGQHRLSDEDIHLDLSDTDVIATLFSASEGYDSWAEDSEVPEILKLDADEQRTRKCFPMDCDVDADGFAWECKKYVIDSSGVITKYGNVPLCMDCDPSCTNCYARDYECEDEHCMCPGATDLEHAIQQTEERRCDHESYSWNGTDHDLLQDEIDKLFHEYSTNTGSPLAWEDLRNIRPRQSETPGNEIDDDCDGYIDETEYVYREFGNDVRDGGFTIRAVINDDVIMQNANYIIAIVYELDNISKKDKTEIMRGLLPKEWEVYHWAYKYKKMFGFPYNADHRVDLEIRDKLAFGSDNKVYAVGLAYFRLIPAPWGWFPLQIGCVDSSGNPDYSFMFTGGYCSMRNRIVSDIYYGAVGASVDPTATYPERTKLSTAITNRAIYEWNLSERGLVGGQDFDVLNYGYGFPPMPYNPWVDIVLPDGTYPAVIGGAVPSKAPDGTRYSAQYGEGWCSEFASSVYNWVSSEVPVATYIPDVVSWFDKYGIMRRDDLARERIFNERGELYGSFLVMNSRGDASGQDGTHSGIFLGLDDEIHNVWRVHGGSYHRIFLDNRFNLELMDDTDTWHYFIGIGQFTDQSPDLLPY